MNVVYYTGVDERLDVPTTLPPYLDKIDLKDSNVLIADDVADTGPRSSTCTSSARGASAMFARRSSMKSPSR